MPVMTLGAYSFRIGPNSITFDQETTVFMHPIVGAHEQPEPLGATSQKVGLQGFVFSTSNQSLADLQNWLASVGFLNRPLVLNIFSQDFTGASSSQPWYSGVGYLTNVHLEYKGGYALYKYPFRFNFVEARPTVLIPASDNGDHQTYTYSMVGAGNGFIAGVELLGSAIQTASAAAQSITYLQDNNSNNLGSGPTLGVPANLLGAGNPVQLSSGAGATAFVWPVVDTSGNQSIQVANPTGNYTLKFGAAFSGTYPSVYAVFIPL